MSKTTPIEALTVHAKQADPDGELVTVSREAVDWAITRIERLDTVIKIKDDCATSRLCPDHNGKWKRGDCALCRIEELEAALRSAPEPIRKRPFDRTKLHYVHSGLGWLDLPKREDYVYWWVNVHAKALEGKSDE